MGVDFREHARDSLLTRLRDDGIPLPMASYVVDPYTLDFAWPDKGVGVLLAWPGREAHNDLTIVGWRIIYLEAVEAWQVPTLRLLRRALGLPLPDEPA